MKKVIYGIIIGATYLIPGLCSASTAMFLGVYNELIEVLSSFYKPKIIKKNCLLIFGMIIGLIISVIIISKIFANSNYLIMSFFMGIIVCGFRKSNINKKSKYILFIIPIIIVLTFNLVGKIQLSNFEEINSFGSYMLLFVMSVIVSIAFILPGISGAMLLLSFGIYDKILKSVKSVFTFISNFRTLPGGDFVVLIVFLTGILVGILAFSKIIDKISKKLPNEFIVLINGFLMSTVITICIDLVNFNLSFINIIISLLSFTVGVLIGHKFKQSNE